MHVPSTPRISNALLLVRVGNDQNKISNANNRVTGSYTSKGKKRKEEMEEREGREEKEGKRRKKGNERAAYSISSRRREDEGHLATVATVAENEMETWISSERETKRSVRGGERGRRNTRALVSRGGVVLTQRASQQRQLVANL